MDKQKLIGLDILRDALGLSVQELADELGVSRGTVWKWGRDLPDLTSRRICRMFGILPEIDLGKELTKDEEDQIYRQAFEYLMSRNPYGKKSRQSVAFVSKTALRQEDAEGIAEEILEEVKRYYLDGAIPKDAHIRIMVDALRLKIGR